MKRINNILIHYNERNLIRINENIDKKEPILLFLKNLMRINEFEYPNMSIFIVNKIEINE